MMNDEEKFTNARERGRVSYFFDEITEEQYKSIDFFCTFMELKCQYDDVIDLKTMRKGVIKRCFQKGL